MITRRMFAAGLATPLFARHAFAQSWKPSKTIRMVVAYPAGGPTDVIARMVAAELTTALGQSVIVDNVSGASGAIGTRQVAKAEGDGHTITFGNNQTHGNNMFMLKEPGYDAIKDFAPLAGVGAFEHVFVTKKDFAPKSIQALIAAAKEKPGTINYGSTGIGSGSHLSTELFMARTGTKMTHVPYRGAPPLVQDLLGGTVDLSNSTLSSVIRHIEAGSMGALAIGSPKRNPKLPNVPTLEEQGVTGANAASWTAFFAPASTPAAVVDTLSAAIIAALRTATVTAGLDKLGFTLDIRAPEAFRPYHAQEVATWVQIAKDANIQPEG